MRLPIALALAALAAGCVHSPSSPPRRGSAPPPASAVRPLPNPHPRSVSTPRPGAPVHRALPAGPSVAHPEVALDAPGAAAVARNWAWQRGWQTELGQIASAGRGYRVDLRVVGDHKGSLRLHVDALSGQVALLDEQVRPHDRGRGHGRHRARHHYD